MSYSSDITRAALENSDFRRELFTTDRTQLVLMSVLPGDDVGLETHALDQVLVFVGGRGESLLNGTKGAVGPGTVVVVPAGVEHDFRNTGDEPLKLFTIYAPPEHPPGTVHRTKADAGRAEALEHADSAEAAGRRGTFTVGSLRRRAGA
jgi:mannose-6-phosphate isomerase-like protein (cupin superfamily)